MFLAVYFMRGFMYWFSLLCLLLVGRTAMAQSSGLRLKAEDEAACKQWVDEQMASMTLKQKVGQLFIHTVAPITTQANRKNIEQAVTEYGIGGLLFSGGDIQKQIQLTNYAQGLASTPLLITFDGEWGLAMRLKGTPSFPRNRILGCIENDSLIYEYGREVARQCREIGVQVNFAPVADVDNNPKNPVINTRSFGALPQQVARKVIAYCRGLEDGGVLSVCKHFPGHGDTETDSHKSLPVLNFSRARLDSIELRPFREAVEAGVGGMMVGHLNVPALGKKPASISPEIINGVLKQELGFRGLVFTDALEMKGISGNEAVCAQALIAGNDMVLAPRNLKRELAGVMSALKTGTLTEAAVDEKCRKVLTYKYILGLAKRKEISGEGIGRRLNRPETEDLMNRLKRAAVTVIKNQDDMLPLDLSVSETALLSLSPTLTEDYPFYRQLREVFPVTWIRANVDSLESIRRRLNPVQQVIIAIHTSKVAPYESLINQLAADKPVVLVCFDSSKTLEKLKDTMQKASAVVLAHTDVSDVQRYVADVLLGQQKADGRLSVPLAGLFPAGTGVTLDPDIPRRYCAKDLGMNPAVLSRLDSIALEGIEVGAYPGCHVLVLREGFPVYDKCFGKHTYEGNETVKEGDIYDLASLTKTTATLLAVMKLYDEGRFGLTDRISAYLPFLRGTNKADITIQDLLYHESGLPAYYPFYQEAVDLSSCKGGLFRKRPDAHHRIQVEPNLYACTDFSYKPEWVSRVPSADYPLQVAENLYIKKEFRQVVLDKIAGMPLKGRSYRYSCLNFILLKELVEAVSGTPMDVYLDSVFYKPMGLTHTAFQPLKRFKKEQIVPTVNEDFLRGGRLQGFVHDEAAAFLGGVSGNAGLFSSAHDVARICQLLLDRGVCGNKRYLTRATCDLFLKAKSKNSRRGLGFDKPNPDNPDKSPCAAEAPASVFGHTGFTGTCAWADPDNDIVFVFLCNRIYPRPFDRKNLMKYDIRTRMQQVIYQALTNLAE